MKKFVFGRLKENITLVLVVVISYFLWIRNGNIGMFFFLHTFFFCAFIHLGLISIKALKNKSNVSPGAIVGIMFYLFVLFVPTVKFYLDMPDYFSGNILIEEGIVNDVKSGKMFLDVYLNDNMISFWDWDTTLNDFPNDSTMRIYYLPRSNVGIDYELIKK